MADEIQCRCKCRFNDIKLKLEKKVRRDPTGTTNYGATGHINLTKKTI